VVCRGVREKRDLLRVVRSPSGEVAYDPSGKMNGRGAYVCRSAECVEKGLAKGRLEASLAAKIDEKTAAELRQAAEDAEAQR
jgi:predicted RNA-binding protein YlxR (DUF448 family)